MLGASQHGASYRTLTRLEESLHGSPSFGFKQAADTTGAHRHLDTSGRSHDLANKHDQTAVLFVQTYKPSGFDTNVKLHTTLGTSGGLTYSLADPGRWQTRHGIGQVRPFPFPESEARAAPHVQSGYTRMSDPKTFEGDIGTTVAASPQQVAVMPFIAPSGFTKNRHTSALAETMAPSQDPLRFSAPAKAPLVTALSVSMASAEGRTGASPNARFSSGFAKQKVATSAPGGGHGLPAGSLHASQARLLAMHEAPFADDPHAHKRRYAR